MNTNG